MRHSTKTVVSKLIPYKMREVRYMLASGKSFSKACKQILKISYETGKRYIKDTRDPRKIALARHVREGEALRGEPLAELICYWLDERDRVVRNWLSVKQRLSTRKDDKIMFKGEEFRVKTFDSFDVDELEPSTYEAYMKSRERIDRHAKHIRLALQRNEALKENYFMQILKSKSDEKHPLKIIGWYWEGVPEELKDESRVNEFTALSSTFEESGVQATRFALVDILNEERLSVKLDLEGTSLSAVPFLDFDEHSYITGA